MLCVDRIRKRHFSTERCLLRHNVGGPRSSTLLTCTLRCMSRTPYLPVPSTRNLILRTTQCPKTQHIYFPVRKKLRFTRTTLSLIYLGFTLFIAAIDLIFSCLTYILHFLLCFAFWCMMSRIMTGLKTGK
ncbi:hypothetical protein RND81_13G101700 [Saponaria officinalis]|uniref:Uncharacterized protein n=1 Tax=Saponaria officinalis TaxID=3572 RepID=A0AAW1H2D9_SAPOF